jgi:spore coat polysaccharide biosynthesis protein SpsF
LTNLAILVFARMDSTRLPGKALADLEGRPLLGRVLDRLRRVRRCSRVVVATSDRAVDDPISNFAEAEGVEIFRRDCDDVAGRALACCEALDLDYFVRISGDSPFVPAELVDQMIEMAKTGDADLVTNVHPRTWPAGASSEIVQANALRRAHPHMTAQEKEDVTVHFYTSAQEWRIANLSAPDDRYRGVRLTVDTAEELERARALVSRLGPEPEAATLDEIVALKRALADAA